MKEMKESRGKVEGVRMSRAGVARKARKLRHKGGPPKSNPAELHCTRPSQGRPRVLQDPPASYLL